MAHRYSYGNINTMCLINKPPYGDIFTVVYLQLLQGGGMMWARGVRSRGCGRKASLVR